MRSFGLSFDLKVKLLNTAKCELDSLWNYCDLISPFSRIYLISKGEGYIYLNNQKIKLEPGFLYLIPAYIPCSYTCSDSLTQYYLHFTIEVIDELNIFYISPYHFKVTASEKDVQLFDRLLEINPDADLRITDPSIYQSKNWVNRTAENNSISKLIETNGVIFQLFSRFMETKFSKDTISSNRFNKTLAFIHNHIDKVISINDLSSKVQMSDDHFTRTFKKEIGITPIEYINQKRIEKAQLLLVVTSMSISEILLKAGFNSASYFNRIFKSNTSLTPMQYRKFHQILHS